MNPPSLQHQLGVFSATLLGLGSILGTGIFVSIGLAAGIAGPAVVLAIALAAVVATFNALSSAQLAAAHPVSGGTYEYGCRYLSPLSGFMAGWMFLLAKSASAATAALGFAGYTLAALGLGTHWKLLVALATVVCFTGIVLAGIRRSSQANTAIVDLVVLALLAFMAAGFSQQARGTSLAPAGPFFAGATLGDIVRNLLHATALMFVAYTGYGRVATLAEEVREPRRTIPRAIVLTLVVSALIYVGVATAAVGAVGAGFLHRATIEQGAPLELALRAMGHPSLAWFITAGAAGAMLGVLLNLILGLSRVLLAMGRRGDMPACMATIDARHATPRMAVLAVGILIAIITLWGSIKLAWSFSAFTVLIYYAITNAAALAMPAEQRLYPRWIAMAGLASCLGLAFFVEPVVWLIGLGLALPGALWWVAARWLQSPHRT